MRIKYLTFYTPNANAILVHALQNALLSAAVCNCYSAATKPDMDVLYPSFSSEHSFLYYERRLVYYLLPSACRLLLQAGPTSGRDGLLMWQLCYVRTAAGDLMLAFGRHCSIRPPTLTDLGPAGVVMLDCVWSTLDDRSSDTLGWPCAIYYSPCPFTTLINIHCLPHSVDMRSILPRWHSWTGRFRCLLY